MYCILVTGIPAAGKSTMAKEIGKQLNIPVISKDSIKEILFDTVGFKCRSEKVALGVGAMEIMYYCAEQLMQTGAPFVLENNFENSSKEGLEKILVKYQYTPITVVMTGDYRVIYERFLERNQSPERHRGHVVNTQYPEVSPTDEVGIVLYEHFVGGIKHRGMDSFSIGENRIVIDTTDFSNVDIDTIIQNIRNVVTICQAC